MSVAKISPIKEFISRKGCWFAFQSTRCICRRNISLNRRNSTLTGTNVRHLEWISIIRLNSILRWDPINKDKMNPYAFVPFGIGPRNCVGMKFSYEEIKIALANLVQRFRFVSVEETPVNVTAFFSGTLITQLFVSRKNWKWILAFTTETNPPTQSSASKLVKTFNTILSFFYCWT